MRFVVVEDVLDIIPVVLVEEVTGTKLVVKPLLIVDDVLLVEIPDAEVLVAAAAANDEDMMLPVLELEVVLTFDEEV